MNNKDHKPYVYTKKPGRPKKLLSDLPFDWKDTVYQLSSQGLNPTEIQSKICGMTPNTWELFKAREPEFAEVCRNARKLYEAWWLEQGRKGIHKRYFHDAAWFMNMKNRFGWKDRQEIAHDITPELLEKYHNIETRELIRRAEEIVRKQEEKIDKLE